jgi:hypothetical protein
MHVVDPVRMISDIPEHANNVVNCFKLRDTGDLKQTSAPVLRDYEVAFAHEYIIDLNNIHFWRRLSLNGGLVYVGVRFRETKIKRIYFTQSGISELERESRYQGSSS